VINIDKNAIQRIECGKRFVTDIEIIAFAKVFNVTFEELLKHSTYYQINHVSLNLYKFILVWRVAESAKLGRHTVRCAKRNTRNIRFGYFFSGVIVQNSTCKISEIFTCGECEIIFLRKL
jgi:transcriptional regulator with XRE-family HTH domain